ncbi:hypothetical protein FQN50_001993 [Emmonsiellopsis sp. PD_5]|nr:hypothetical protein FQN50_001993 [Emmonsiellopsis sp. PD_5]
MSNSSIPPPMTSLIAALSSRSGSLCEKLHTFDGDQPEYESMDNHYCGRRVRMALSNILPCPKDLLLGHIGKGTWRNSLRNFELYLDVANDLNLDMQLVMKEMAVSLAIIHWQAKCDGMDPEWERAASVESYRPVGQTRSVKRKRGGGALKDPPRDSLVSWLLRPCLPPSKDPSLHRDPLARDEWSNANLTRHMV